MTENEKRLQETIESIKEVVESNLNELWKNHKNGAIEQNGFVNLALIQQTRKTINNKLFEIESHWKEKIKRRCNNARNDFKNISFTKF